MRKIAALAKKMLHGLAVLLVLVLVFEAGSFYNRFFGTDATAEAVENDDEDFDLQLPGEVEKHVVTVDEIKGKLEQLNEWSTYSGNYPITKSEDFTRYMLDDIAVPGTTNTVNIDCSVVVKVGFNADDINVQVDDESGRIYISMPELVITDSYIIWDSVNCDEENNILNPIDFGEYQSMFEEIEAEGVSKAEEEGIYDEAMENAERLIEMSLAAFSKYEVVFLA
ncbi:MAG: DUF4230 domain-containing protein [Lachnospiraceae bacterium]|nr:DUF4230 domain-containing protein [Lachnospiraceae bacterium]